MPGSVKFQLPLDEKDEGVSNGEGSGGDEDDDHLEAGEPPRGKG